MVIRHYDFFELIDHITSHFMKEFTWSVIYISYTDFRKTYGAFYNDNIDTYAARYIEEDDIIELNTTSDDVLLQRRIYNNNNVNVYVKNNSDKYKKVAHENSKSKNINIKNKSSKNNLVELFTQFFK